MTNTMIKVPAEDLESFILQYIDENTSVGVVDIGMPLNDFGEYEFEIVETEEVDASYMDDWATSDFSEDYATLHNASFMRQ